MALLPTLLIEDLGALDLPGYGGLMIEPLPSASLPMFIRGGYYSASGHMPLVMWRPVANIAYPQPLFIQGPNALVNGVLPLYTISTNAASGSLPLFLQSSKNQQVLPLFCAAPCNPPPNAFCPLFISCGGAAQMLPLAMPNVDFPWSNVNGVLPLYMGAGLLNGKLPMYMISANHINGFLPIFLLNQPSTSTIPLFINNLQKYYNALGNQNMPLAMPSVFGPQAAKLRLYTHGK